MMWNYHVHEIKAEQVSGVLDSEEFEQLSALKADQKGKREQIVDTAPFVWQGNGRVFGDHQS